VHREAGRRPVGTAQRQAGRAAKRAPRLPARGGALLDRPADEQKVSAGARRL